MCFIDDFFDTEMSDKVEKRHEWDHSKVKLLPTGLMFGFVQKHKEWFGIIVILTAIQSFISTGIFIYFEILFVLLTTVIGGTIGASVSVENMKEKTEQKMWPAKFGVTLFFILFSPATAIAGLLFGGIIGLTIGCCSILIWNLWVHTRILYFSCDIFSHSFILRLKTPKAQKI